eukprot:2480195-Amphidinium_carterae.1
MESELIGGKVYPAQPTKLRHQESVARHCRRKRGGRQVRWLQDKGMSWSEWQNHKGIAKELGVKPQQPQRQHPQQEDDDGSERRLPGILFGGLAFLHIRSPVFSTVCPRREQSNLQALGERLASALCCD